MSDEKIYTATGRKGVTYEFPQNVKLRVEAHSDEKTRQLIVDRIAKDLKIEPSYIPEPRKGGVGVGWGGGAEYRGKTTDKRVKGRSAPKGN